MASTTARSIRNRRPPERFIHYVSDTKHIQLKKSRESKTSCSKELQPKPPLQESDAENRLGHSIPPTRSLSKAQISKRKIVNTKTSKGSFDLNKSGSFEKYGIRLPNLEDVIEYQRVADRDKLMIDQLTNAMSLSLDAVDVTLREPKKLDIVLDCKHLTKEEIGKLFLSNLQYINGIANGTIYSKRHELYTRHKFVNHFNINNLRYNTSMITFTFEQKQQLLDHMYKHFRKKELRTSDQYFFQVLLPELCVKIFMDVHNMSQEVAVHYLDERPVI